MFACHVDEYICRQCDPWSPVTQENPQNSVRLKRQMVTRATHTKTLDEQVAPIAPSESVQPDNERTSSAPDDERKSSAHNNKQTSPASRTDKPKQKQTELSSPNDDDEQQTIVAVEGATAALVATSMRLQLMKRNLQHMKVPDAKPAACR